MLKRAWAEVRHGHNIDLYLALAAKAKDGALLQSARADLDHDQQR